METAYDTHIEQIVQSIFDSMLGMQVVRVGEGELSQETLIGTIQIAGVQAMSVVLGVSAGVARNASAAMLQMTEADVTNADERDVVAELANMIGGNLKSLLPGPLFLSLPTVVAGKDFGLQVPGAALVEDVPLQCDAGALRVRLYAQLGQE